MKKFSTLEKTNRIIAASLIFFVVSFFIHTAFKFDFFLNLSGFFLALYFPGLAIVNLFNKNDNWLNKLVVSPVFTIFVFIPLYYALTLALGGKINFSIAVILTLAVSLFSLIITARKAKSPEKNVPTEDKKFIYFGICAFILVHLLTTLVYKFIPEIDGYTDLIHVENIISSGIFDISYRPLFPFLVSYISLVSQIPPYWLFKFGMILIQISGVYYLHQIIKIADIKSSIAKYLILLSFVSVPIINIEIDYIRPNVILIFALLPFIYYLSRGIDGMKINFLFSSIIAATGLLFHEFFGIIFLINLLFIATYFYKRFSNIKKLMAILILFVSFLLILININRFPIFVLSFDFVMNFMGLVTKGLHWKWWYLNDYLNMDGNNLGWNGFWDVSKYYAYSLSPFLAFVFLGYIFTIVVKIKQNEKILSIEKVAIFILFIGLFFAEFLPRINYKTLPDRFWPIIAISLIALAPFVFSKIELFEKKVICLVLLILLIIGISGSVYIAKAKRGYTSNKEYAAAQWIKKNTPENALFVTQDGNSVMLNYFANRKTLSPYASFFLNEQKQETQQEEVLKSNKIYKNITALFNTCLENPTDDCLSSLNASLKEYNTELEKEKLRKNIENFNFILSNNEPIYVLYSLDKFNNYYGRRQWWKKVNFYEADFNKFKEGYDLVYNNDDTVYIWKKR